MSVTYDILSRHHSCAEDTPQCVVAAATRGVLQLIDVLFTGAATVVFFTLGSSREFFLRSVPTRFTFTMQKIVFPKSFLFDSWNFDRVLAQ